MSEDKINRKNVTVYYGELDTTFDGKAMSIQVTAELKPIDKSTTYFGLYIVSEKCLMEKFARIHDTTTTINQPKALDTMNLICQLS